MILGFSPPAQQAMQSVFEGQVGRVAAFLLPFYTDSEGQAKFLVESGSYGVHLFGGKAERYELDMDMQLSCLKWDNEKTLLRELGEEFPFLADVYGQVINEVSCTPHVINRRHFFKDADLPGSGLTLPVVESCVLVGLNSKEVEIINSSNVNFQWVNCQEVAVAVLNKDISAVAKFFLSRALRTHTVV